LLADAQQQVIWYLGKEKHRKIQCCFDQLILICNLFLNMTDLR
jgi:hypothetical protein